MQKILLLIVSAVFSVNCFGASAPNPAKLAASHGYVFVQLPRGFPFRPLSTLLSLTSLKTDTEYPLEPRNIGNGVAAMGLWLPAGEYKMGRWDQTRFDEYPTITVKAGQLTDMGQLVPIELGAYKVIVLPLREQEALEGRAAVLQEFAPALSASDVIEWRAQDLPKSIEPFGPRYSEGSNTGGLIADLLDIAERAKARTAQIKQLSAATSIAELLQLAKLRVRPQQREAAIDAQSTLYFGADLGQIRTRTAAGEWGAVDTGSLRTVTAVEVHGSVLAAGLDSGAIRISKDAGATWTQAAAVNRDEPILDIDYVGGRWLVMTRRFDQPDIKGWQGKLNQVRVYSAVNDDFSDLALSKTMSLTSADLSNWGLVSAEASGEFYYLSAGIHLLRLDTKTMQWETLKTPPGIRQFHASPQTETLTLYSIPGMFSKQLYISTDRGVNWRQTDTPVYTIHHILYDSADTGHGIRSDLSDRRAVYKAIEFNRASGTWTQVGVLPKECAEVLADDKQMLHLCLTRDGSIMHNNGGKWVVEFLNE